MTEIQQWQPAQTATAPAMKLVEWAQEADAAYSLAARVVASPFCPEAFRGKPAEGAVAMLAGTELGLSPLAALGAFDVIQGRAAPRAITLRALVQSKGHDIVMVESTETRCIMKGRRRDSSEWQKVTWTLDRAKAMKLTGKDNWQKQPGAMLVARATAEIARLIASDAILGIAYSSEELYDGGSAEVVFVDPAPESQPSGTRRMSRAKPATLTEHDTSLVTINEPPDEADEPPVASGDEGALAQAAASTSSPASSGLDGFTPEGQSNKETGESITAPQSRMLHALLNANGLSDREAGLAYIGGVVGTEIDSTKSLTKAQASSVIDRLNALDSTNPAPAMTAEEIESQLWEQP